MKGVKFDKRDVMSIISTSVGACSAMKPCPASCRSDQVHARAQPAPSDRVRGRRVAASWCRREQSGRGAEYKGESAGASKRHKRQAGASVRPSARTQLHSGGEFGFGAVLGWFDRDRMRDTQEVMMGDVLL